MFDQTSRYFPLKDLKYTNNTRPNSSTQRRIRKIDRTVLYKERRFLPQPSQFDIAQEIIIVAGDRLDNISFNTMGDPEQFWRICDANEVTHPLETTSEPGNRLHIGIQRAS